MEKKPADDVERAYDNSAKDHLGNPVGPKKSESGNSRDDLMKIAVPIEDDCVMVPGLSRPKPDPAGPPNERANENQQNPH